MKRKWMSNCHKLDVIECFEQPGRSLRTGEREYRFQMIFVL